jgi:hypothetical protein
MRKLFFAIWGVNTVALLCLFGAMLLYGGTPGRKAMAADLAEIWAGLACVAGWEIFASRRTARQAKEKAAGR